MVPEESGVLLSLVIAARNDDYMGDFKWRLATSLNYLARNLSEIGRLKDVQVTVCDWGSDPPLAAVLDLNQPARMITNFAHVSAAIAMPAQKDSPFPYSVAQNVGIRHSAGRFIAHTDSDILFPKESLSNLLNLLDQPEHFQAPLTGALLLASRRQIPFLVSEKKPALEELDRYLALYGSMLKVDRLTVGLLAPSALSLMHRSIWEACAGYDERLIYWEWMDIDLYLRITQKHPWFDVSNFGVVLYHLEHYPDQDRLRQRKTNPWSVPFNFRNENAAQWGLWDQPIPIQKAEKHFSVVTPSESDAATPIILDQTLEQIRQDFQSDRVAVHVRDSATKVPSDPTEVNALRALAWYSLNHRPARYLEFGIRFAHAAAVVALAYPAVEIYGVDTWRPLADKPNVSIHYSSEALTRLGHCGYLRFITGDPDSAMERLRNGFIGELKFELVMFRGEIFGDNAFRQAVEILPHLTAAGMMVVSFKLPNQFTEFWRLFKYCCSQDECIELDHKTGVVLKKIRL